MTAGSNAANRVTWNLFFCIEGLMDASREELELGLASAPQNRLYRIKDDQLLCKTSECGKASKFLLHRYVGAQKPDLLPYCEHHARQIAADLRIPIPDATE